MTGESKTGATRFQAIFSDIGGVLGTNGWDTDIRRRTAQHFGCAGAELEGRHRMVFDSFERGFMSFDDYIRYVFFAEPRPFLLEEIKDFVFRQSIAWPQNIELLQNAKRRNGLKLALLSNEGEGITGYRVKAWGLRDLADFMVFSHCVKLRKPDRPIWQLALDLAQLNAEQVIYIDDRPMFVQIAAEMGFAAIHHTSLDKTQGALESLGLRTS